jgi:hypothetical protein
VLFGDLPPEISFYPKYDLTNTDALDRVNDMEITVREAASRLKVTPGRVRQLIATGRVAARHVTTTMMLIDEKELNKPDVKSRKPGRPWPKKVTGKR